MLGRIRPDKTRAWEKLADHFQQIKNVHMKDLFAKDPQRFDKFSVRMGNILVDYSKNRINERTIQLLTDLANEAGLKDAIDKMFSGDCINETENRPVLHTALRNRDNSNLTGIFQVFLNRNSSSQGIGPTGIFKSNGLNLQNKIVDIQPILSPEHF